MGLKSASKKEKGTCRWGQGTLGKGRHLGSSSGKEHLWAPLRVCLGLIGFPGHGLSMQNLAEKSQEHCNSMSPYLLKATPLSRERLETSLHPASLHPPHHRTFSPRWKAIPWEELWWGRLTCVTQSALSVSWETPLWSLLSLGPLFPSFTDTVLLNPFLNINRGFTGGTGDKEPAR